MDKDTKQKASGLVRIAQCESLPYFCSKSKRIIKMKGVLEVSKEQVIEIERYCDEYGITRKQRIDELGLSRTAYYYTRGLLSEEELQGGQFIPIMSGSGLMQTASMPVGSKRSLLRLAF